MPAAANPSWGAEAFMDTPLVNGTAYPTLEVQPKAYRFRLLNASHDRFFNLQLYLADPAVQSADGRGFTEVKMLPATATPGFPDTWPTDGRPGGVPDPKTAGPAWVQISTEGGFLPAPVLLENLPIGWNMDPTTFTFSNVNQGTMILGPAERSDVVIDFSKFAGRTLILYNDSPAPYPALDPHYDYFTGVEDLTDVGGSPGTPVGYGPNTRTIMQIKVSGTGGVAPVNDYDPMAFAELENAFRSTGSEAAGDFVPGVFAASQHPIIVAQSAYDTTYNKTFPAAFPYWGLARIGDETVSFVTPEEVPVRNYFMQSKAIQDEMGEVFDEYGRMSAKIGLELAVTVAGVKTFMLQNYVDPTTEKVLDDEPQIWKITQNGVDTHPVHFHLFEVQLLNRVGWDGFISLPEPNELGWKDTVRISPLEDTIVALRSRAPKNLPFTLPMSTRVLNPSLLEYNPADPSLPEAADPGMGFTQINPVTGLLMDPPVTNQLTSFFAEYVWHCHILSHEEADMMRSIILHQPGEPPALPARFRRAGPSPDPEEHPHLERPPVPHAAGAPPGRSGRPG